MNHGQALSQRSAAAKPAAPSASSPLRAASPQSRKLDSIAWCVGVQSVVLVLLLLGVIASVVLVSLDYTEDMKIREGVDDIRKEVCEVNDRVLRDQHERHRPRAIEAPPTPPPPTTTTTTTTTGEPPRDGIDARFARECEKNANRTAEELRNAIETTLSRHAFEVRRTVGEALEAGERRDLEREKEGAERRHGGACEAGEHVLFACLRTPHGDSYPVEAYDLEDLPDDRPGARLPYRAEMDPHDAWDAARHCFRAPADGTYRVVHHFTALPGREHATVYAILVSRRGRRAQDLRLDLVPALASVLRGEGSPPTDPAYGVSRDARSHTCVAEAELRAGDAVFAEGFSLVDSVEELRGEHGRLAMTRFCGANYLSIRRIASPDGGNGTAADAGRT